jgi:Mg2+-importing ATPase
MATSSNFGNMFSVVGASAFLPLLPMLPIQVLTNNLLYDFSQTAIPTGWFVESLFAQTLIIHVIRTNKIPFIESRASWPLILTSVIIVAVGAWLIVSPLARTLGFVASAAVLAIMLLGNAFLTQVVKSWFICRFGE